MGALLRKLDPDEQAIEERIRTISLAICALGVVGYGLYTLRSVLVPLVLAIALTYLLQPLIDLLSVRPLPCSCCGTVLCRRPPERLRTVRPRLRPCAECLFQCKLPRTMAVCVALAISFAILGALGFVVADSIHIFTKRAGLYSQRVQDLATGAINVMDHMREQWVYSFGWDDATAANATVTATDMSGNNTAIGEDDVSDPSAVNTMERLAKLAGKVPVTDMIVMSLTSMMEALSNLALVLLFAVYLLLGTSSSSSAPAPSSPSSSSSINAQADAQINVYIRGKVAMSLLVGTFTAISLGALSVDLWLVFGLLAFWLNFIPNVGTVLAVALPMPLVILDPKFSGVGVALAFLLPLGAHAFAGNVLEPVMFGHTLKLHPVTVLLSLLLWGAVWGVTGMVLAVPITAVLRIRLAHVQHPLPQFVANLLVGEMPPGGDEDESSTAFGNAVGSSGGAPSVHGAARRPRPCGPVTPMVGTWTPQVDADTPGEDNGRRGLLQALAPDLPMATAPIEEGTDEEQGKNGAHRSGRATAHHHSL